MPRAKGPKPGEWRYTVGDVPHQLTAYEREDRGGAIYTRLWTGKAPYRDRRPLCGPIRDERGRVDADRENEAQRLTIDRHKDILAGLEPDERVGGPLTLTTGFRRLLHPKEGKYAGSTRHRGDVSRAAKIIKEALGADLRWEQVRHAHYRKLWRHMAHEHAKAGRFGHRYAEVVVGALQSAARWLQQEGHIEPGDAMPAPGWKAQMKAEWEEITSRPVPAPKRPRYTPREMEKLWSALPKADPRLHLALEIGAELRLGQIPRSRRSDVHPSPDGRFAIGAVRVHGKGKKRGSFLVLTPEQRRALTRAMTRGVLADLEAARRQGMIEDYYLIPGGRLRTADTPRGKYARAQVKNAGDALGTTGLRKQWKALEKLAGVKHAPGRNWYGIRRLQADRAEDIETDARVLNQLGAWTHTATRELYQEEGRPEIAQASAAARRKLRPGKHSGRQSEGKPND